MLDESLHQDPLIESSRSWLDRWRRPLLWLALVIGVLTILFYAVGSWFFSNLVYDQALDPDRGTSTFDIEVLGYDGATVSLSTTDAPDSLTTQGVWGLETVNGYGQVETIISKDSAQVVRRYVHIAGAEPVAGVFADMEVRAYPVDPLTGLGLGYEEVKVEGDLGAFPGWFVDGTRATWVICYHGNALTRLDCMRLLSITAPAGYPTLVGTYRNNPNAPADPSGLMQYGRTEWPDVQAGVAYAIDHGAQSVVVAGISMGGAVVTSYLMESGPTDVVAGVILDAPALDLGAAIDRGADDESLPVIGLPVPRSLVTVTKWVSQRRWDVDFGAMDYLARADELDKPILLFHGEEDSTVPISISEELSRERPDLIWDFIRGPNAEHTATWNVVPEVYAERVLSFLEAVAS
jgi:dienelactone hydrolase